MQIRQLEYFVTVCETLNFTKAAKRFFISQTAVTQQIKSLENELGIELFYRNNRHVEMTPAGKIFLEDAKAILRRTEDARFRLSTSNVNTTGYLKIGYIPGYDKGMLPSIIADFLDQYPNISPSFVRGNVENLYSRLLAEELDIIFNISYTMEHLTELNYKIIKKYPLYALVPSSHPLAHRSKIKFEELEGYAMVDIQKDTMHSGEANAHMQDFMNAGFTPEIHYLSDDIDTSILAVSAGLGYTLLPSYLAEHFHTAHRVTVIPIDGFEQHITIVAAWHKNNQNPALKLFLKHSVFH